MAKGKRIKRRKYSFYFLLYKEVAEQMNQCVRIRDKGRFGIGFDTDALALRYQGLQMRFEILDAYLSNRPANWHIAKYLDRDEAVRRTERAFMKFNAKKWSREKSAKVS